LPIAFILLRREIELLAEQALHLLPLAEIDEQVGVVLVEAIEVSQNGASELLARRQIAGSNLAHPAVHPEDRFLDDEVKQIVLALEMMVKATLEDPDSIRDVLDGGGVIALPLKHPRRCRNDLLNVCHG
jgi:hypothetical protein